MTHQSRQNSPLRLLAQFALALAALAASLRIAHLATIEHRASSIEHPASSIQHRASSPQPPSPSPQSPAPSPKSPDTELAEFYKACPLAAVIDLDTIAHHPEKIDEILPPHTATVAQYTPSRPAEFHRATLPADGAFQSVPAARTPNLGATPAADIPRIQYPTAIDGALRIAARGPVEGPQLRIATSAPLPADPAANTAKQGGPNNGDWLIDPKEWFEAGSDSVRSVSDAESAPSSVGGRSETAPAPSSAGGVSDADAITYPNMPSASERPPANESPAAEEPASQRPATDAGQEPASQRPATDAIFAPPPATPTATEQLPTPPSSTEHPASSIQHRASSIDHPASSNDSPAPSPQPPAPSPPLAPGLFPAPGKPGDVDPHLALYAKNAYPSARECAVCHEEVYEQWSMSAHAYAAVSPMFNKFEQRLNDLAQGTVGYFCMRCHAPVATSLCASRDTPLWQLPEVAREGITCVACHRVQYAYGKSNGERRIETGDIHAPVFGGIGGDGVAAAIARKDDLKLKTSPDEKGPGQNMHVTGIYFQPLTRSEFCTPCHQVAVYPGIKLEVVWEQYRASPACKKGIQCQDCHMGRVPGLPLGYDCGPVAKMNGKTVNDNRRKSNHVFFGPNYPIAHPGIFPFNLKANRWTMDQWLTFDWRAGWGTKDFEDAVADGRVTCQFPPLWAEADDRMDAREIIDANLKKMELKRELRIQVMENGSKVEGPFFDSSLRCGQDINFHYIVTNTNDGHNLLTASLGAQPQLWANVVLIGPNGQRLWETGYTDSAGDVANIHSYDVRNKTLPFDWQLFNLQTMFLITGAKGTDREFYVPVNLDIDQIPFIRPGTQPITVLNHPPFIRMESQSLAPLGSRRVPYRIPGELVRQPGTYRLSFRMRSRSEPIYFMRFCGATEEMERSMNEWMIDVHPSSVQFEVR